MTKSRNCCMCKRKSDKVQYSLHCFPKNEVLRKIWKTACGYQDYDEVSTLAICSAHFKNEDYIDTRARERGGKSRLKPGAYPSIEMPVLVVTKTDYETRTTPNVVELKIEHEEPVVVKTEEQEMPDEPTTVSVEDCEALAKAAVRKRIKRISNPEAGMSRVELQNYRRIIMSRCRLCQLKDGTIPLTADKRQADYVAQFTKVSPDNAKKYPESICEPCSRVIDAFAKFVKIVDCVNVKLTRFITNGKFTGAETDEIVNMLNESPLLLYNYSEMAFPGTEETTATTETKTVKVEPGNSIKLPDHVAEGPSESGNPNEFPMLLHNYAKSTQSSDKGDKSKVKSDSGSSKAKSEGKRPQVNLTLKMRTKTVSDKHQRKEKEKVPYICELCGESFPYHQTYQKHKMNHVGWFKCKHEGCDKVYISYRNYKDHLYRHSVKDRKTQLSLEKREHECQICNVAFESKLQLWQHQPTHENIKCTYKDCDEVLATWNYYKQHLATHEPYLCSVCGKTFVAKSSLYMHEYYNHKNKVHKCNVCNRTYKNKSILTEHVNVHHKGIQYLCTMCPKMFLTSLALKRHNLVHKGVRPFKCSSCTAAFYTKPELKNHAIRHTGVKNFVCVVCEKPFYLKSSLRAHMKAHSNETFLCSIDDCNSTFYNLQKLERHISQKHLI